jgi:hypothetical protein
MATQDGHLSAPTDFLLHEESTVQDPTTSFPIMRRDSFTSTPNDDINYARRMSGNASALDRHGEQALSASLGLSMGNDPLLFMGPGHQQLDFGYSYGTGLGTDMIGSPDFSQSLPIDTAQALPATVAPHVVSQMGNSHDPTANLMQPYWYPDFTPVSPPNYQSTTELDAASPSTRSTPTDAPPDPSFVQNQLVRIVHTQQPTNTPLLTKFKTGTYKYTSKTAAEVPRVQATIPKTGGKTEKVWRCAKPNCKYCVATAHGHTDLTESVAKGHGLVGVLAKSTTQKKRMKAARSATCTTVSTPMTGEASPSTLRPTVVPSPNWDHFIAESAKPQRSVASTRSEARQAAWTPVCGAFGLSYGLPITYGPRLPRFSDDSGPPDTQPLAAASSIGASTNMSSPKHEVGNDWEKKAADVFVDFSTPKAPDSIDQALVATPKASVEHTYMTPAPSSMDSSPKKVKDSKTDETAS